MELRGGLSFARATLHQLQRVEYISWRPSSLSILELKPGEQREAGIFTNALINARGGRGREEPDVLNIGLKSPVSPD